MIPPSIFPIWGHADEFWRFLPVFRRDEVLPDTIHSISCLFLKKWASGSTVYLSTQQAKRGEVCLLYVVSIIVKNSGIIDFFPYYYNYYTMILMLPSRLELLSKYNIIFFFLCRRILRSQSSNFERKRPFFNQ